MAGHRFGVEGLVSSVLGFADREFDAAGDDGQDNPKTIDTKPSTLNPRPQTESLMPQAMTVKIIHVMKRPIITSQNLPRVACSVWRVGVRGEGVFGCVRGGGHGV